ncbi:hypothetical protein ACGH2B_05655 [Streptomyces sp. BBFR2]|uniref:hypothetical protein n=1 Tax=Streptomyces sp. BBFR2 TaxID=3372854 RepID=UPI0037DA1223
MSGTESEYIPATICYAAEHETNFAEMDMDTMQAMVKASNPGEVHNVSKGWKDVYDQLVGGSGGGIKGAFDAAVKEVLQHWEGTSADKFREQANKISKKISDCSLYADYTSRAMKNAASVLEQLKPEVESMEKPGTMDSAVNWFQDGGSRDDSGLKRDLANPGMTTQQALDNNTGNLSSGKEQQLRMAVKMEQLGAAYVSQAKAMGTWKTKQIDKTEDYPGPPGGEPPAPVPMPMPTGGSMSPGNGGAPSLKPLGKGPGFSSEGLDSPKTSGISGGIGTQPGKGSYTPDVSTGLDSFQPPKGAGGGGLSGGIGGGGLGGAGGGLSGGAGGGVGGGTGAGGIGGGMGVVGGGAGAGGAGRGAGRTGMPGMGGAAGAGRGAGAKGAGGAGRGGALARQKGGVIGAGKGKAGAAGQGGSGLHRSRGGAQAGAGAGAGGRRPAGMAGAPGVHGSKGKEKGQNNGERPDYLVEDEETWASERNVAPKVIE